MNVTDCRMFYSGHDTLRLYNASIFLLEELLQSEKIVTNLASWEKDWRKQVLILNKIYGKLKLDR